MDMLKLLALDEQDLTVISAHVQDAITRVGDLKYLKGQSQFVAPLNRFAWEKQGGFLSGVPERRNSVLHFGRVGAVRLSGVAQDKRDETLMLLAVSFTPGEAPSGTVRLNFSGGATIELDVECIEARLTDLGGAWQASSRPRHRL
jgi:hypothetical protein